MSFDPVSAALEIGGKLIDRLWPDPAQKAAATLELAKLQQTGELAKLTSDTQLAQAQADIDKIEAASPNWFIAGWRPAVGWTCGVALAYVAVLNPIGQFIAEVMFGYTGKFPTVDATITMQILFGMLGLGGLRTYEKVKNAEGNR